MQTVRLIRGTLAQEAYGVDETTEMFLCNFGLNPKYQALVTGGALKVTGVDPEGAVRVIELAGHRFFMATLFLPQLSSRPEAAHPLIIAYLRAAEIFRKSREAGN
jgi:CTP synthase (UTP-ammonia lyase)